MKYSIVFLLFFVFSFLFRSDLSFDQDLGRHIGLGEIIFKNYQVPKVNLFSYTNPDFPFINTHWLFEVLAYLGSISIGVQAMIILKVFIFLFSVWLTLKVIPRNNRILLLPIGFIFLHVLRERLEFRPEIFSFLFTALTYSILETTLRAKRVNLLFFLLLIQLIWINTHIYFFIGLLLQGIFIIHLLIKKEFSKLKILALIFLCSIILSLLNPNGISGLLYPLNVNTNYGYTIVENQTMFLLENIEFRDPNFLFVKLSLGIIGLSILFSFISRRFELKNILLALSGAGLSLLNVRSFPYIVFLSLPAVLQNFGIIKKNIFFSFLSLVTCGLLLLESFFYLNGDYYKYTENGHTAGISLTESVKGAMDFVLRNDLPSPIYNNFDIGSYIIYRGYPKYQVFVDGRPEAYPAKFFTDVYIPTQSDDSKFKLLEDQYEFKTIIFSITDQTPWGKAFLVNVVKDESWKTVYIDDFTIVLVKDSVAQELKLETINLSKLTPSQYAFSNHLSYLRLGIFLLSEGYPNSGKVFIERALQLFPNDPFANSMFGRQTNKNFFW